MKSGYWQLKMDLPDSFKTYFSDGQKLRRFVVLPYGLTNAVSTYSRFMKHLLGHLPFANSYIVDVLIASSTEEEHFQHIEIILDILVSARLKLNIQKCQIMVQSVKFVGYYISSKGIKADPKRTQVIAQWKTPANLKELSQFLGLCNLYHLFLTSLSRDAEPLFFYDYAKAHIGLGELNKNKPLRI